MSLTQKDYEAIAAYDRTVKPSYNVILMLVPDKGEAAVCTIDNTGLPHVTNVWQDTEGAEFPASLRDWKQFSNNLRDAIIETMNTFDDTSVDGMNMTAKTVMSVYQEFCGGRFQEAFNEASHLAETMNVDYPRVICLGDGASFFPAEAMARHHFSALAPLLEVDAYVYYEELTEIIQSGGNTVKTNSVRRFDKDVLWRIVNAEGREECLIMAESGAEVSGFLEPRFPLENGVFVTEDEKLTFSVNGSDDFIRMPGGLLRDGIGMIRMGLRYDPAKEVCYLVVSECREMITREFAIDVRWKGRG